MIHAHKRAWKNRKQRCMWMILFIWGAYTSIVQENKEMERVDQTPKG